MQGEEESPSIVDEKGCSVLFVSEFEYIQNTTATLKGSRPRL